MRIRGDPMPAVVSAVVLNCVRLMVCVPLTAVLAVVILTSSTLELNFWNTVPVGNVLAAGMLYQPRLSCSVVPSVTSCTCATSIVLATNILAPILMFAALGLVPLL